MRKTTIIFGIVLLQSVLDATQLPDTCRQDLWITNGNVHAIAPYGDRIYIGGTFSKVGPYTGSGVPIDRKLAVPANEFPHINGSVTTVCSDGGGGWFVGGSFTLVGKIVRNNIAHIFSDGTLDIAWNPSADSSVVTIIKQGATLYVSGMFTSVGGKKRNLIASIDVQTGTVTAWNPIETITANTATESCVIKTITISGTAIYIGGQFSAINSQGRSNIAAFDAVTGQLLEWNPGANYKILHITSLFSTGATVYAGGAFGVSGSQMEMFAAFDSVTGMSTGWKPPVDYATSFVSDLIVNESTVYAAGRFTSAIGGNGGIVGYDRKTGAITDTRIPLDGFVFALALHGDTLYAGGDFKTIAEEKRDYIAAIDIKNNKVLEWNPGMNNGVLSLAADSSTVFAGGTFTSVGGVERSNLAALDARTGSALYWNPDANDAVYTIIAQETTVYAGGFFDTVGGLNRNFLVAIDAQTGNPTDWNPDVGGIEHGPCFVSSLCVFDTTVFAGGNFSTIGIQTRNYLAAIDAHTGKVTDWNPNADRYVFTLVKNNSVLYVGGYFSTIGGQNRKGIAAFDIVTGNVLDWNANAAGRIQAIAVSGANVYVGGSFSKIGGQNRENIAALDSATGIASDWNPHANDEVTGLAVQGSTIFVTGAFSAIGGQNRTKLAALDTQSGNVTDWNPTITLYPSYYYGYYTTSPVVLTPRDNTIVTAGGAVFTGMPFLNIGQGYGHPSLTQFGEYDPAANVLPQTIQQAGSLKIKPLLDVETLSTGRFVKYQLSETVPVLLQLFTMQGKLLTEITRTIQCPGTYRVPIKPLLCSKGFYIVKLKAGHLEMAERIVWW